MYFCFDHGVEYGEDGFMCPECEREREICETHDDSLLPSNSFTPPKTTARADVHSGCDDWHNVNRFTDD